jgi:glucosyl-dolichyl phosphate glucuronosyltransferase
MACLPQAVAQPDPFGKAFASRPAMLTRSSSDSRLATVIIPTYNRSELLGETLDRLAAIRPALSRWSVLVVDNNSNDDTRAVVERRQALFPVPLMYLFESRQGRSWALNAGIGATTAPALVFTDDDVIVGDSWLDVAVEPLLSDTGIAYTGGPVHPIWEGAQPAWLSTERPDLWGTIAILDYGKEPFVFEDRQRVPLGANMAVHRSLFDRIGLFNPTLGRAGAGKQLLGQEVPEFLARSRRAGARGLYQPSMMVEHHVPARRLTKEYFRRWWYGKGRSRAELDRLQPLTELGVDLSTTRQIAGVPAFMFRSAAEDVVRWIAALAGGRPQERFKHEMMLCYFAAYVSARRQTRRLAVAEAH